MFMLPLTDMLSIASGSIVGLVLGLVGGGGSILAVPLLVYLVGMSSTHVALGTSAFAVGSAASVNLFPHWRAGNVKWRCATVFSLAGVIGAISGSTIAKQINGDMLLAAFGVLMLLVGALMLRSRKGVEDPNVRLVKSNLLTLGPRLIVIGLGVGLLSGFFGIGGGFLIVPGLMFAANMPIKNAIATSLVSGAAFGFATAGNYAVTNQIDWRIALMFVMGAAIGGLIGAGLGRVISQRQHWLQTGFAIIVIGIGLSVIWNGLTVLMA